jgi:hypothetical protein
MKPRLGAVHMDITQGTPHRRGGQLTGGGCLPAESRGGQRGVGGKESCVGSKSPRAFRRVLRQCIVLRIGFSCCHASCCT